ERQGRRFSNRSWLPRPLLRRLNLSTAVSDKYSGAIMTRRRFAATGLLTFLALAIACTRQPSTPASPTAAVPSQLDASADGSTLKATAPAPISPINDQQVSDAPALTASPPTSRCPQPTVPYQYQLQLANDPSTQIQASVPVS